MLFYQPNAVSHNKSRVRTNKHFVTGKFESKLECIYYALSAMVTVICTFVLIINISRKISNIQNGVSLVRAFLEKGQRDTSEFKHEPTNPKDRQ